MEENTMHKSADGGAKKVVIKSGDKAKKVKELVENNAALRRIALEGIDYAVSALNKISEHLKSKS